MNKTGLVLHEAITSAISKILKDVHYNIDDSKMSTTAVAVAAAAGDTSPTNKIGIAFSGGVDSALLTQICHDMGYTASLLTVGFAGSHDVSFAKEVYAQMNIPKFDHYTYDIDPSTFTKTVCDVYHAICTDNISWNENCIAFHYVAKLADSLGIKTVITANGIDELFCGYDAYRRVLITDIAHKHMNHADLQAIHDTMKTKLYNEKAMSNAIHTITSKFKVRILWPLLSEEFVMVASQVPISEKILGSDDMLRKHAIRRLAAEIKVPEISHTKRKKALQYGSGIHKAFLKVKKRGLLPSLQQA